ncbi:NAD-dependent epimerase/dehydratase family protein [Paraglaciecola chathamensis]|uniref:NAD-dependent epimerase/dehydratase family protein n=1 Tax=Paraglaciecola chathamensis TaxID=368405 RepID=UPI0026FCD948|nr:NAD-dependent epimerase/dehydratase family protein [Paraglaciecola chathamensis]MDO6557708.1 NAD-dependent epimerase/dehydratase family protein [Paraglaciecola chathamensis]
MENEMVSQDGGKPIVLITGASGNIGTHICRQLNPNYTTIGLDRDECECSDESYICDLTSDDSIELAMYKIREKHGKHIAAVVHLAAYFDFTGKPNPLYEEVNIKGTERLLSALNDFDVKRFIYSSTMLVHKAGVPGQKVDEDTPVEPAWEYPKSKAGAETVIIENDDDIPYTILRLAGLYDDGTAVPTLSQQIARVYERDMKSHVYAGDLMAGQSFIHQEDMIDVFEKVIERRESLPKEHILLAGEEDVMSYQALQNRIGSLLFGETQWSTINVPDVVAKAGAWVQVKSEPVVPDAIDQGEKPFIKPFMIDLASQHYHLDISRAKEQLDWQPKHNIYDKLATLTNNLTSDPSAWYKNNGITRPDWIKMSREKEKNSHTVRKEYEKHYRAEHQRFLWAHFLNIGLAFWLLSAPSILGYESQAMSVSNYVSAIGLMFFSCLSLSWRMGWARWGAGLVGFWLLCAPLVFWAPSAAGYLNDTLVGMLILGFAVCSRPTPGVANVAAETGPAIPTGWDFNPSGWLQRFPVIVLAFVGFFISRYLCAYQLGHIDAIWDPFFTGIASDPQNGTEEIITSSFSQAWPVPDAGLGAMTYALEIITGIMGSTRRWRTMPWLVMLFGIMIVPLGAISIFFIIIQPILLGTWCTLCLIAAAAMLIQIPYSLDELVATSEFLYRRKKQGRPLLRILFTGDTDEGSAEKTEHSEFERPVGAIIKDLVGGGVTFPPSLVLCLPIGLWLMFTRMTLGAEGEMVNADHLIGALVITVVVIALAETGRAARFALIPLGAALFITPFVYGVDGISIASSFICAALLIALSLPKGKMHNRYGLWDKAII